MIHFTKVDLPSPFFPTKASRSGNYPVICEDVRKAYGSHVVFHDVNLTINRGEKVAFVWKNGEGKSTLVICIMDEIDFEGKLTIGQSYQIQSGSHPTFVPGSAQNNRFVHYVRSLVCLRNQFRP